MTLAMAKDGRMLPLTFVLLVAVSVSSVGTRVARAQDSSSEECGGGRNGSS